MKPENKMLLAVLEITKDDYLEKKTIYFKTRPMGLNSISANLKGGKLYIELQQWPREEKKEMAGNIEIQPLANETDVPF